MPLLDHFHPPLLGRRHWESLHVFWAAAIADRLNANLLPAEYFAEFRVMLGKSVEVDLTTCFAEADRPDAVHPGGADAVLQTQVWTPPTPVAVFPAVFPDEVAVHVFSEAGATLVGAIELLAPGNKDRDETRRAFAVKCAAYLQRGIGLIVVDIVTSRHANLHDELMALLGHGNGVAFPTPTPLYATAYRPAHRQERNEIDLWREPLAVGQPLPTLPLAVRGLGCLPIDLEATYQEARKRGRIG